MHVIKRLRLDDFILPLVGFAAFLIFWQVIAGKMLVTKEVDDFGDTITKTKRVGISADLPAPGETWTSSKPYIMQPFAKRGELDQGILSFTKLSLGLVMQGYLIALVLGTPLGFCLGLSKTFTKAVDPIIQVLRPVSPLAWFPLGLVLFSSVKLMDGSGKTYFGASDAAALFTIAVCSMWPTVMNTAVGVRAVPQDYLNVAKVLKLSKMKTLWKVLVPATLPYMFTGFRLSLGLAWLVIVAVEMLTGRPGVGGFLWQEYNAGSYSRIVLCILTIGVVGLVLDRLMSVVERRFKTA
ncbi:nitrate/nitrite transport system permease protein [Roseimicrobium gellanilyticum]|uniref:Nitrate/nitrite transport system permease protein n=1 Tax=Roseimicrobium gellanilyticum TaxID=748857 RepID=A0A366HVX9_9BACT|nr:nitrate ABC transporter permease [Roseimicrobium gellanilyticum]RBP47645.1 nitrate/nitrite transport system permease protein [Roseimicrobium gellanilyticum]